ncbi:cytochrome d ubiquinol oxidase subunit II [Metallibacterium sp.]|uniref:cytochrome d ubiquinol oxidase subunit II n=1 Tax=Metallibacterium sp. TaxID=2940281 RepID=UPI00260A9DCD|nr:cytochrome d ubiquinol oxidase subunit II [Metallibacterium sp.]
MEPYAALQVIWWLLLGVLLSGLAVMVGMDMGVGTILRYVGRSDLERRVALNIIGPHWDGNQVWFVLGGGAVFAAFPLIYATAFSGFYVVMLLLLWTMILRPLGFEYRSKIDSPVWRNAWDWALLVSGAVPMVVFGAAFGNLFHGVPFHFEWNLTSVYTGSFLGLLNPFAILCGLLALALSVMMGALTVMNGAEGVMQQRARTLLQVAAVAAVALFAIGGVWLHAIPGYRMVSGPGAGVPQTPLQQVVEVMPGAWQANFAAQPVLWLLPLAGFAGMLGALFAGRAGRAHLGWWLGALAWIGVIGSAGAALFPFLLPSSSDPSVSLTLWNASSSRLTLSWMLGMALVFVPLILWYTSWAFWVMRGKVRPEAIAHDEHAY